MGKRAVFLDRDGVLLRAVVRDGKPYPPPSLAEADLMPGVAEALARLKEAGFVLVVVTNQPDVARGTQTRQVVEEMNAWLIQQLPLDDVRVCYHDEGDGCGCRKPKPGLLVEAAAAWGIDLKASYLVGDRWRDIGAGQQAGCTTFWIDAAYAERQPDPPANFIVSSLPEAVEQILHRIV